MATVAEQLRQAREARNLTVQQVAEITKIRSDHIRALDEGNYDAFPAPVYIRGFVRTYADFLKLDVPSLIEQVNDELGQSEKHREDPTVTPRKGGFLDVLLPQLWRVKWKVVLPATLLLLVLAASIYGYRQWASQQGKDPAAELGSGMYQPRQDPGGDTLPLPNPQRR